MNTPQKRILITGGAGFIGSNLAAHMAGLGWHVTALDNLYLGTPDNLPSTVTFIEGDACKQADLEKCGDQFDAVVALAGTSSAPMFTGDNDIVWAYENSVTSFMRTLEFARATGAKKLLYASTSSLYGNNPLPLYEDQHVTPLNHYAVTKGLYEHASACYNKVYPQLDIIGFRFMSVYGPNEEAKGAYANMISQFAWDIARGRPPVIFGDGNQFRDFTHVTDVIQGITRAIDHTSPLGARVYNIGRGESTSFNDIFAAIKTKLQSDVDPIYIENPVKEGYVKGQHADITRIKDELGYAPATTLEEGVNHLIDHLDISKIRHTSSDLIRDRY